MSTSPNRRWNQPGPLSKARWQYLKNLRPGAGNFVHISAHLYRFVDPLTNLEVTRAAKRDRRFPPGIGNQKGVTWDRGRNAAKRDARAAKKFARSARRSA